MNSNTVTHFLNFEPAEKEKKYIERALEDLRSRAPRWSYITAKFSRKNNQFEGVAQVHSGSDFYKVELTGGNIFSLVGKIRSKVISQMKIWRSKQKTRRRYSKPIQSIE